MAIYKELIQDWICIGDVASDVKKIIFNLLCRIAGMYNCIPSDAAVRVRQGGALTAIMVYGKDGDDNPLCPTKLRPSLRVLKTNGALEQLYTLLDAVYASDWMEMSTLPLAALGNNLVGSDRTDWVGMTYCLRGRALVRM
jgi:hypothetical protein